MDLTSKLIEQVPPAPISSSKWPVLSFTAGAVLGILIAIGGTRANMDMLKATEGEPLQARLTVLFGSRVIHTELSSDIERLLRERSYYPIASMAIGLVGGGILGLASTWLVMRIAEWIYPTDMSMATTPMSLSASHPTPLPKKWN